MSTIKIALATTIAAFNAIGPGRQVCVAGASVGFAADVYASKSATSSKTCKIGSIATGSGTGKVETFAVDSSVALLYVVTAGSLGTGAIWVQGPGAGTATGVPGSAAVALATTGVDVSGLLPGPRQIVIAGGTAGAQVAFYSANSTSGTFALIGNRTVNAAGSAILQLPNDSSVAMKYAVTGSIAIGGSAEVYVTGGDPPAFAARLVATSIGANTVSGQILSVTATGALGTQDGGTVAVGDVVLFPAGLSNVTTGEAGPWTSLTLGDTTSVATFERPSWWQNGQPIPGSNTQIRVRAAGTLFPNTTWRNTNGAGSTVIGTDEPQLFPDMVVQTVTLSTGAATITNVPIFSATKSSFRFERSAVGGTVTTTIMYGTTAVTAGPLGTASVAIAAQIATGGTLTTDTSTGRFVITNFA